VAAEVMVQDETRRAEYSARGFQFLFDSTKHFASIWSFYIASWGKMEWRMIFDFYEKTKMGLDLG
jgi:hypothetical protein